MAEVVIGSGVRRSKLCLAGCSPRRAAGRRGDRGSRSLVSRVASPAAISPAPVAARGVLLLERGPTLPASSSLRATTVTRRNPRRTHDSGHSPTSITTRGTRRPAQGAVAQRPRTQISRTREAPAANRPSESARWRRGADPGDGLDRLSVTGAARARRTRTTALASLARRRPRAVRGNERGSGGDGALFPVDPDPRTERRLRRRHRGGLRPQRVRAVGGRGASTGARSSASSGSTVPQFEAHFTPAVEIGWRLDRRHWGRRLRHRGRPVRARGRDSTMFGLDEIVSFTSTVQRPVPAGDGPPRHAPRPGRRLRPPADAGRATRSSATCSTGSGGPSGKDRGKPQGRRTGSSTVPGTGGITAARRGGRRPSS